jgi:hypothetical protein
MLARGHKEVSPAFEELQQLCVIRALSDELADVLDHVRVRLAALRLPLDRKQRRRAPTD